jgi:hypothetical protein
MASALAADGRLMLGAGETVIGQTELFTPDGQLTGIYRRVDQETTIIPLPLKTAPKPTRNYGKAGINSHLRH